MRPENRRHLEKEFQSRVIDYRERLAAGSPPASEVDAEVPPELRDRFQKARAALNLLHRVWPRSRPSWAENAPNTLAPPSLAGGGTPGQVGPFRLIRELGRGGFGVVFLAEDLRLGRQVALKVPTGGSLVDLVHRQRFLYEAQVASELGHENIVPVYEAGEAESLLYIASEYCPGPTLAQWIKERKGRPTAPRGAAELVAVLAWAMHSVHVRGILHRDLKPRNILLKPRADGAPDGQAASGPAITSIPQPASPASDGPLDRYVPKVTDFGLALSLQGDRDFTHSQAAVGTVGYMAPEQLRGRRAEVGTHSDVWALGVILYELLTSRLPFRGQSDAEVGEQVLSHEPQPPSRLAPAIPRDLEAICLKCLHKEPSRRYASAAALADDLQRFVNDEPIQARPVGTAERVWLWCRRKPAVAGLAVTLFVVLASGFAGVIWQWQQAERGREEAKQQKLQAEENFRKYLESESRYQDMEGTFRETGRMLSQVGEVQLANVPQTESIRREILEQALKINLKFLQEKATDLSAQWEAGIAFMRVGDIRMYLGHSREAEEAYRRAIDIFEKLPPDFPNQADSRRQLARCHNRLANLFVATNRFDLAKITYDNLEGIYPSNLFDLLESSEYLEVQASTYHNQALRLSRENRPEEGEKLCRRAVDIEKGLVEMFPDNWRHKQSLANSYNTLAVILKRTNQSQEARVAYQDALNLHAKLVEQFPRNADLRAQLGTTHRNLAIFLKEAKQHSDAQASFRKAQDAFQKLVTDFPRIPHYHSELGEVYFSWSLMLAEPGQAERAFELMQQAASHHRITVGIDPHNPRYRMCLCKSCYYVAGTLMGTGQHAEASKAAAEMASVGDRWMDFYNAAVFLIHCTRLARSDPALPEDERQRLSEAYAGQAVGILRQAAKAPHIDPQRVRTDPVFDPLRSREDFRSLLTDLDIKQKTK